ncbi:YciI family protein [Xanthobacter sediminis]
MVAHGAFWQDEADCGRALAVGPVADPDGIWGLALVEVGDEADAHALAARDPVITANLGFAYKVMPLLSLMTGRAERPASDSHIRCRAQRLAPADI